MALTVVAADLPPHVMSFTATPLTVNSQGQSTLQCIASYAGEAGLTYNWSASGGTFTGSGPSVTWTAPSQSGTYSATCSIADSNGSDSRGLVLSVHSTGLSASISPLTGVATSTQFTDTGSGATPNGQVTGTITLPSGNITTATTTANSSGQYTFAFTESQPGTYTEVDSDARTGAQSNVLVWTVTPTGIVNIFPTSFNPVFTVGGAPATLGFYITNQSGGSLTGTITATTNSSGPWLTVNGHTSYNWVAPETDNVTANPAGLSAGTYTGSLLVSTPNPPNSVTIPVTMTIYNALQITTTSLPDAVSGLAYNLQLQASGGSGTGFVWSLQSGTLPLWLTLNPSTGVINGNPYNISGSTTNTVNIGVQDSAGHFTYKTFSIVWREGLAILPISPSNFQFVVGSPYTAGNSITFQAVGGTSPYTWRATGLPPGLSVVASSGLVTGTPTQPGSFTASVTVTDAINESTTSAIVLPVVTTPLVITNFGQTPPNLPSGTVGTAYSQTLTAQGGSQSGYTWSVQGNLPPGLTAGNSPGCPSACALQISGTPTQAGTYTFTAIVTDSLRVTSQQNVTIVINTGTPPAIATSTLTLATVGQPYTFSLTATGGSGFYQWSLIGNGLDSGLQLSSGGVLSGTSTVANDCPSGPAQWTSAGPSTFFQVQVKDSSGQASVHEFCLPAYYPTPQINSFKPPSVIVDGLNHTITVNGTNFRSNAYLFLMGGGAVTTTYVSSNALSFSLTPALGGAFSEGGVLVGEGTHQLWAVEPYSYNSNEAGFPIYDPVPTLTNVTAVLNNSNQPCTTNLNCQLVINGSGLVYATTYAIRETGQSLVVAANPGTPIPWNTITTSAFSVASPGTYTIVVTNPNQPGGGTATATATFTVAQ